MSIYITGDTHSMYDDLMHRISKNNVKGNDTVIIAGNFGFISNRRDDRISFLKLRNEPYAFWFIDGNHECYPLLNEYPIIEWNGGHAQVITPNIVHLLRGEIYEIGDGKEKKSLFCLGGAYSVDKPYRIKGDNCFDCEQPSIEDYKKADRTLNEHADKVDYILTHTAPWSVIRALNYKTYIDEFVLDSYLEKLKDHIEFEHWFFGHFHTDRRIGRFTAVYEEMIRIL